MRFRGLCFRDSGQAAACTLQPPLDDLSLFGIGLRSGHCVCLGIRAYACSILPLMNFSSAALVFLKALLLSVPSMWIFAFLLQPDARLVKISFSTRELIEILIDG